MNNIDKVGKWVLNVTLAVYIFSAYITIDWFGWWATIGWVAAIGHVLLLKVILGNEEEAKKGAKK